MNNRIKLIISFILTIILLIGCSSKSSIIGEYHNLNQTDYEGMVITEFKEPQVTKEFSEDISQEVYNYFLDIETIETYTPKANDTGFTSLNYIIVIKLADGYYNLNVGDDYILVSITNYDVDPEGLSQENSVHLIDKEVMTAFEQMLNDLIYYN